MFFSPSLSHLSVLRSRIRLVKLNWLVFFSWELHIDYRTDFHAGGRHHTSPRSSLRFRTVYAAAWLILIITSWLVLKGTQDVRNTGDMARFGSLLFRVLGPLQLALVTFLSALRCVSVVAQEKDRRTLILLLMTRLSNNEIVLGKLFAGLLDVFVALLAAFPLFVIITLFGGVSLEQVLRVYGVTVMTALVAGSTGTLLAFWREKTFQTLAITALSLVIWAGFWEAIYAGVLGVQWAGIPTTAWAEAFSPVRAIAAASRPSLGTIDHFGVIGSPANAFLLVGGLFTLVINFWSIVRIRIWNPSREAVRLSTKMNNRRASGEWTTTCRQNSARWPGTWQAGRSRSVRSHRFQNEKHLAIGRS